MKINIDLGTENINYCALSNKISRARELKEYIELVAEEEIAEQMTKAAIDTFIEELESQFPIISKDKSMRFDFYL